MGSGNGSEGRAETGETRSRFTRVTFTGILLTVMALSTVVNVVQARRIAALREISQRLRTEGRLAVGATVPPLVGKTADGRRVTITHGATDVPTVMYVFSASCGWCARNADNIRALAHGAASRFRFVGVAVSAVSSDRLAEVVSALGIDFEVVTDVPEEVRQAYRLGRTPSTIVVSREGRVMAVWAGAYADALEEQVEQYFQVDLPGLLAKEPAAETSD